MWSFGDIDGNDLNLRSCLEQLGTSITAQRGERLLEQEKPATGIYIVLRGHIGLFLERSSAKRACVHICGPGAFVGMPVLMTHSTISVTAEVLDECELVFVLREAVVKTLNGSPDLSMQALDVLSQDVREMRRALVSAKHAVR